MGPSYRPRPSGRLRPQGLDDDGGARPGHGAAVGREDLGGLRPRCPVHRAGREPGDGIGAVLAPRPDLLGDEREDRGEEAQEDGERGAEGDPCGGGGVSSQSSGLPWPESPEP